MSESKLGCAVALAYGGTKLAIGTSYHLVKFGIKTLPYFLVGSVPYGVLSTFAPNFIAQNPETSLVVSGVAGAWISGAIYRGRSAK